MKIKFAAFLLFFFLSTGSAFAKMEFNNTSNPYISVANSPANTITRDMTISAWVYLRSFANVFPYMRGIASRYNTAVGQYIFRLNCDATAANKDNFCIDIIIGGLENQASGATDISLNTWYHVAATYDGSVISLYVNGVLDASTAASGNLTNNTDLFIIGRDYLADLGINDRCWDGHIDDLRLYDRALSSQEVQSLYSSRKRLPWTEKSTSGGYWRLDDGAEGATASGGTVRDYGPNADTGIAVNGPTWRASEEISYP